jgi:[acyl-carrier-protein] S-malonyltransferase
VQQMATMGVNRAIEIGPGKVLSGLVRRIAKEIVADNVEAPEQIEGLKQQEGQS